MFALDQLLQLRFVIRFRFAADGRLDFRSQVALDKFASDRFAAVQVNGGHQGFEHVRQQGGGDLGVAGHAFAQDQEFLQPQLGTQLRTRLPADNHGLDAGQVPLQIIGVLLVQHFADHPPQDGVSQELQPFVGRQPMVGPGGVGEGGPQQFFVLEFVSQPSLATFQEWQFVAGHVREGGGLRRSVQRAARRLAGQKKVTWAAHDCQPRPGGGSR